jgi:hypothetical protein
MSFVDEKGEDAGIRYLEDGDEVIMKGWCYGYRESHEVKGERKRERLFGLGECRGVVLSAS